MYIYIYLSISPSTSPSIGCLLVSMCFFRVDPDFRLFIAEVSVFLMAYFLIVGQCIYPLSIIIHDIIPISVLNSLYSIDSGNFC